MQAIIENNTKYINSVNQCTSTNGDLTPFWREFINDNKILKNDIICIIHGIGSGIIRNEINNVLKKCNDVIDYKLFYNNVGCTLVKIKL